MNIQHYIASGNLELYAMGALPEREHRKTGARIAAQPELYAELQMISKTLEQLARINGTIPDPQVRQELLMLLDPELRDTFEALYYRRYKQEEAAGKLNLSPEVVQERARQAVNKLRALLEARRKKG